jgi:hypothetical protein
MIEASFTDNGHTVTCWGGRPLGIACRCGHRVVVALVELGISSGDMRPLRTLPFVCSSCGSRQVGIWMFGDDDEVARFVEHGPPSAKPADPSTPPPIVIDGAADEFTPRGWVPDGCGLGSAGRLRP